MLAVRPSWAPLVANGWAFSSSGFSIGTVALMTLALKSFCPGFGAFSVDTRYCLVTAVCQKALVIVGTWLSLFWEVHSSGSLVQNGSHGGCCLPPLF